MPVARPGFLPEMEEPHLAPRRIELENSAAFLLHGMCGTSFGTNCMGANNALVINAVNGGRRRNSTAILGSSSMLRRAGDVVHSFVRHYGN